MDKELNESVQYTRLKNWKILACGDIVIGKNRESIDSLIASRDSLIKACRKALECMFVTFDMVRAGSNPIDIEIETWAGIQVLNQALNATQTR